MADTKKAIDKEYLLSSFKGYDTNIAEKKYLQKANLSVDKLETAETGFLASYQLSFVDAEGTKTALGEKINIPRDYLVKSASIKTSTGDSDPSGLAAGKKFIDFVVNVKEGTEDVSHIYISLDDLANYEAGNSVDITGGVISVVAAEKKGISSTADGLEVVTGNGITLSTDGAVIVKANDGIEVTADGVGAKLGEGLKIDDDGAIALDFETEVVAGNGIEVADDGVTISAKAKEKAGISVTADGIAVSTGTGVKIDDDGAVAINLTEGDGVRITNSTIGLKLGTGLKVATEGDDEGKVVVDPEVLIEFESTAIDWDNDWN